jgi:D-alanine-D-alanine ligase
MRVAVLAGGRSSEHEVSLHSAAFVREAVAAAGHEVVPVTIERGGAWVHDGEALALTPGGGLLGAEAVFPVLHGPFGEDGTVQGLLELLDVPYVGSGVLASAACLDKVVAKDLMARAGLAQVDYAGVSAARWESAPDAVLAELAALGMPVFVKPAHLGSSVGIAKVPGAGDLAPALDAAFAHDPCVIVEAMSDGVEVECSVLGATHAAEASEPGEIVIEADWYDFAAKYEPGGMRLVVPARISAVARERVQALAVAAFARFGCSGLARADFFVEGDEVLLNELNTMPGFTATSVYAKLWEASGLPYEELVTRLCELALARHAEERAYRF